MKRQRDGNRDLQVLDPPLAGFALLEEREAIEGAVRVLPEPLDRQSRRKQGLDHVTEAVGPLARFMCELGLGLREGTRTWNREGSGCGKYGCFKVRPSSSSIPTTGWDSITWNAPPGRSNAQ